MNDQNNSKSFLAVSFSQGFISPNIPIVTFTQGGIELNFVLDTGTDNNVIDSSIIEKLDYQKTDKMFTLSGVGGTQNVETCILSFSNGDEKYTGEFLITDLSESFSRIKACHAIHLHGMLGSCFLRENNLVLDFNKLVAYNKV